jgi:DNA replication protein DnaC
MYPMLASASTNTSNDSFSFSNLINGSKSSLFKVDNTNSINSSQVPKKMESLITTQISFDNYNEETIHKIILVGDSGVGKTSLLVQFDVGKFQPGLFSATVGIGFTVSK